MEIMVGLNRKVRSFYIGIRGRFAAEYAAGDTAYFDQGPLGMMK